MRFFDFTVPISNSTCIACHAPIPQGKGAPLCPACLCRWEEEKRSVSITPQENSGIACARHLSYYDKKEDSVCRAMVLHAKEKLDSALCRFLGKELASLLPKRLPNHTIITYVPRRKVAIDACGYDQAKRIAKALAKECRVPCRTLLKRRTEDQGAQKEKDAQERIESASNAYACTFQMKKACGKHVILIDDVTTTGASLRSCAVQLKECGAKRVDALTIGAVKAHKRRERKERSL